MAHSRRRCLPGQRRLLSSRGGSQKVLPGFNLTLGYTIFYLCLIVLIPLSALLLKTFSLSWDQFWTAVTSPRVLASYRLTFGASFLAALVNVVFGLLVAWVLVRYSFPGKRIVDALVDLPFALPTAVPAFRSPRCWPATAGSGSTWSRWGSSSPSTPTAWSSR